VERSKEYAIAEWAECPKCGTICDAPFQVDGSDAVEPELVLGQSVPENVEAPAGRWQIKVVAICPGCGIRLEANAFFEGRISQQFILAETISLSPKASTWAYFGVRVHYYLYERSSAIMII
jgi:hypothetical protein